MDSIVIAPAAAGDAEEWAVLRHALWPHHTIAAHGADIAAALRHNGGLNLVARRHGLMIGFAEASLRHDYVNGCTTSPVSFIEGLYVAPEFRRRGIATRFVTAITAWGQAQGCSELASDALLDNSQSHAMHTALGFTETGRVVYFRKVIG